MSAEQEKIKNLAYQLWQDAGSPDGRDQEFWYTAEVQVKAAKPAKAKAAAAPKAPKAKAEPKAKAPAAPKAAKPKAKVVAKV